MGWPLGGNWDRATTPPGASFADVAQIMAAICTGINQRESQYFTNGIIDNTVTQWYNTGDGTSGATVAYPTAASFAGPVLRGYFLKNLLESAKDAIEACFGAGAATWKEHAYVASPGTNPSITFASVWAIATTGYTWNPTVFWDPDNYAILRRCLDQMIYLYMSEMNYSNLPWGPSSYNFNGISNTVKYISVL